MTTLASTQTRILAAITELVDAADLITRPERIDIYRRAYRARLLECLRTMFPALQYACGGSLFEEFALTYLDAHPPRSFTLAHLADRFPQYLDDTRPPHEHWPDFLIEVARVELAFLHISSGEGLESHSLSFGSRLAPAPSLRLFDCRYPVHAYIRAARADRHPTLPGAAPCTFALTRRNYHVTIDELPRAEFELLSRFDGIRSLEELAQDWPPARVETLIEEWVQKKMLYWI